MELSFLHGENFSGRTQTLRAWAGLDGNALNARAAYIPPDASEALSGLAHTVRAEIELCAFDQAACDRALGMLEALGFSYLLEQEPFTLSGGETVVVAIVAAAAGRPERLAIDCSLEQLAAETRTALVAELGDLSGAVMIADNRLDEWQENLPPLLPAAAGAPRVDETVDDARRREPAEIVIRGLSFAYPRGARVFDNFDLTLAAGKPYLLRGPNGAGKSTLSKILCGLLKPSSGEIFVNGRRVKPWRRPARWVSYHFQNPSLQLFGRTAKQELRQAPKADVSAKRFGVGGDLDQHPLDLPYVLRKRLAIAAASVRRPDFIILDEPTLGQDKRAAASLSAIFTARGGLRITHARAFAELDVIELRRAR